MYLLYNVLFEINSFNKILFFALILRLFILLLEIKAQAVICGL